MSKIVSFLRNEPVVVLTGFINAGIELAVNLGFHLTPGVQASILTVSLAVVALVTRSQVTPTDKGDGTGA